MAEFEKLITLTQISDGAPGEPGASADQYRIEFSQEEILKFAKTTNDEGKISSYTYSPERLTIKVYKNEKLTMDELVEITVGGVDITNDPTYFKTGSDEYILEINYLDSVPDTRSLSSIPFVFKIKEASGGDAGEQVSRIKTTRSIICRNGMNSDMATFALNVEGINAAIQYTALSFKAEGLTVTNGGIKIVKNNEDGVTEQVFWSDTSGNLFLKGNITATEGYIGNIAIKDNSLVGDGNAYIISPTGIVANNITLRQGAVIENYIQLGNSYLYNPDAVDPGGKPIRPATDPAYRAVLQSGNLLIKDTGYMTLGGILLFGGIDGGESAYISSKNDQWKIWENGRADFQDIYANNCHIGNTILEANTIQSAGNLTVYADSWTLAGAEETSFLVDRDPMITYSNENPIVLFGKNEYYQIVGEIIKRSDGLYEIPVNKNIVSAGFKKGDVITKIGRIGEAVLCISGQGSNSAGFATESSLTLAFLENFENDIPEFDTKLSLGLLDKLGKSGITGYGLYAENVYLKGSLTTVSTGDSVSYAGINTTNGIEATIFKSTSIAGTPIDDTSSIIFWAGANPKAVNDETLSEERKMAKAIQSAPFQVTENGTLYASKGVFEGSIISKSTIQGSDIYAARIHGWEGNTVAPLTIYDTTTGIVFKTGYKSEDGEIETLSINSSGLVGRNKKQFILLEGENDQTITFQGNYTKLFKDESQIMIDSTGIKKQTSDGEDGWVTQSWLDLNTNFSFNSGGIEIANFDGDLISLKATTTNIVKHVQFGESEGVNLRYKQVDAGYDLYVN